LIKIPFFTHEDKWRFEIVQYCKVNQLLWLFYQLKIIPADISKPCHVLDAGCGISLIPYIFKYWGLQVTALDICEKSIELARGYNPDESDLAKCILVLEPEPALNGWFKCVDDPERSLAALKKYQSSNGSLSYMAGDWCTAPLKPESFNFIYCRNSLRCSIKSYWRQSLKKFWELLAPQGILLLENQNAIGIKHEVEELVQEEKFLLILKLSLIDKIDENWSFSKFTDSNNVKYAICFWPTG
jgi:SAM-dependent methyltransferase